MTNLIVAIIIIGPIIFGLVAYHIIMSVIKDINLHFDNNDDDEYQDTLGI
jgi:hypothetical protein